jgi:sugar phosphate isomerase/epimerase
VTGSRSFGVSTRLFEGSRLERDHLRDIAAHGFDAIELRATTSHFDVRSVAALGDLQGWLAETGLLLHSVHAPTVDRVGLGGAALNLASGDAEARGRALSEVEHALYVARRIPFRFLVVHLGVTGGAPGENRRDAARKSIEALHALAEPLGVRLALEVLPNELSRSGALVHFIDDVLDGAPVGIGLDFGHAHIEGDLVDTIETVSEHLVTVDLHDNRGRTDEHLVPFEGSIDWPSALTTVQKIGYDGPLMLELSPRGAARETLGRARAARDKLERLLAYG